jgi:hypothetical protein
MSIQQHPRQAEVAMTARSSDPVVNDLLLPLDVAFARGHAVRDERTPAL